MSDIEVFTDEETNELSLTQKVRKSLINTLTQDGLSVPDTGPKQVLLLGLLDGSDRSTLSRAKMRADKKRDETMQSAVKVVGEVLKSVNARTYRPAAATSDRILPSGSDLREFVPGEMDINPEQITSLQLMTA